MSLTRCLCALTPTLFPTGGFAALRGFNGGAHPFTLALVATEGDGRLPRASTCFNTLYLPSYSSPEVLAQRLAAALEGQQAFDEGAAPASTGCRLCGKVVEQRAVSSGCVASVQCSPCGYSSDAAKHMLMLPTGVITRS